MMNLPDTPTPSAVLSRLEALATTTPPLAAPLERIAATLRTAQCPTLGTDSRVRLLWEALEQEAKVIAYLLERDQWREAAEQRRAGAGG